MGKKFREMDLSGICYTLLKTNIGACMNKKEGHVINNAVTIFLKS